MAAILKSILNSWTERPIDSELDFNQVSDTGPSSSFCYFFYLEDSLEYLEITTKDSSCI